MTADYDPRTVDALVDEFIEAERGSARESQGSGHILLGLGTLYGYLSPLRGTVVYSDLIAFRIGEHPFVVLVYVGGVHHEQEAVGSGFPVDEQVVDCASVGVEHHSVDYLSGRDAGGFAREDMVHELSGILPRYEYLAHVRHVEHSGGVPYRVVLVYYAAVLNGHVVTCKGTHLGTKEQMPSVQTSLFQQIFHRCKNVI